MVPPKGKIKGSFSGQAHGKEEDSRKGREITYNLKGEKRHQDPFHQERERGEVEKHQKGLEGGTRYSKRRGSTHLYVEKIEG